MPKIIRNGITYTGLPDIDFDCELSTVTLYAANWSNGVYTITDNRIDATSVQEYAPAVGITDDQLEALQAANICDAGQDTGHAYLKAYGNVPSIDIPIRIMFNPGVKTKEVNPTIIKTVLWEGYSQFPPFNESWISDFDWILIELEANNGNAAIPGYAMFPTSNYVRYNTPSPQSGKNCVVGYRIGYFTNAANAISISDSTFQLSSSSGWVDYAYRITGIKLS